MFNVRGLSPRFPLDGKFSFWSALPRISSVGTCLSKFDLYLTIKGAGSDSFRSHFDLISPYGKFGGEATFPIAQTQFICDFPLAEMTAFPKTFLNHVNTEEIREKG